MISQAIIEVGDVLAERYQILAPLGTGGAAQVYLAVARSVGGFNKLVVLKVPRVAITSEPDWCETFLREARVAARFDHPNIVQTFEVTQHGDLPLIVMEYLRGLPLSRVLWRTARSPENPAEAEPPTFSAGCQIRV